nr:PREDICTED: M-phase inducer phosphatase 1 [Anolis carolinensis]|eukprot:XP_008116761.2 PREDICTED: M-phase inducer phosphatase 1 [Anolis carolinensis]
MDPSAGLPPARASHRRRLLLSDQPGLRSPPDRPRRSLAAGSSIENCLQTLDAKNVNLQRTSSSESTDSGCCMDSPVLLGLKDLEDETFRLPMRRMYSLPHSLLGCSPALKRGLDFLGCDAFQACGPEENKENEPFEFKKPSQPVSRSCLRTSPIKDEKDASELRQKFDSAFTFPSGEVPGKDPGRFNPAFERRRSRKASEAEEEEDDGFLEIMDGPDAGSNEERPSDVASLWTAPLVMKNREGTHNKRCRLMGTEHQPFSMARMALKRMERPQEDASPCCSKRMKNVCAAPSAELTVGTCGFGNHFFSLQGFSTYSCCKSCTERPL